MAQSSPPEPNNLFDAEAVSQHADTAVELLMRYGPKLLLAVLVLCVGLWLVNRLARVTTSGMERSRVDPTLTRFFGMLISIGLKTLLIISVASMIGVETTSFIAVLGAAGLAIGLALQGSLGNFAGGVLVLLFKPYRVGDYIEAQGVSGTVADVQIFNTVLKTPDNRRVIVPNGALSNGIITNYSAEPTRRVDFVFGIGYEQDIAKARNIIGELLAADPRTLAEPAPQIVVGALGDNSVDLTVRVWTNAADYWGLFFDITENVKLAFDEHDVTIPFPQRVVHLAHGAG